jgi:hypothetical protein
MDRKTIDDALVHISAQRDPTLKAAELASLCSAVFHEHGMELVVVGGSAIELLTEGKYTSGDLDLCMLPPGRISLRQRQELMGKFQAEGGPRTWRVAGLFVDLLGQLESLARTPLRKIEGPYGTVHIAQPEELLVERILVSVYPQAYQPARDCARILAAVALRGEIEIDWAEVRRLAGLPDYRIVEECEALVRAVANELKIPNPFDSDR